MSRYPSGVMKVPSESFPSLSSLVVDGVDGRWDLTSRRGGARPVMGVAARGDGSVRPLVFSAAVLLLLASFSMDNDIKLSSSSSSDAEFNSSSVNIINHQSNFSSNIITYIISSICYLSL